MTTNTQNDLTPRPPLRDREGESLLCCLQQSRCRRTCREVTASPFQSGGRGVGWLGAFLLLLGSTASADPLATATVGMSQTLSEVVIPGPELEAKPIAGRAAPVVLRIVRIDPHGNARRYTIDWYGLDPGDYDLRDFLRRKDGQPLTAEVPRLPVRVEATLPPGQIEPSQIPPTPAPAIGGYWSLVRAAMIVWVLGFALLIALMVPRGKPKLKPAKPPQSLADKLRPLVAGAVAGTLAPGELAALERSLLALWRKRLKLEAADPGVALATMHADPNAGPLLNQLEVWLHHPDAAESVDVAKLLEPYRRLSPDELPAEVGVANA